MQPKSKELRFHKVYHFLNKNEKNALYQRIHKKSKRILG